MLIVDGAAQTGPPADTPWHFTGDVWSYLAFPPTDGVIVNTACFAPAARTYWHTHEKGQLLLVVGGRGFVQAAGEPAVAVHAGTTVWTPPGEEHWHGAARDTYMAHVAVSLGTTEWGAEVTADEYGGELAR